MEFQLTDKQVEANRMLAGPETHCCLEGGSRSGKTFLLIRAIVTRALKAPGSRHAIFRFRFNHVVSSIFHDTFPKVMSLCFPGRKWDVNKSDWYIEFENGSRIVLAGLDDKERTERVLGTEYVTLYFNECSQIPWGSRGIALTRLAQHVTYVDAGGQERALKPKAYYDYNPPSTAHWTYQVFENKRDPETKKPLPDSADIVAMKVNPEDNKQNLPPGYMKTLEALPARLRKRFLSGQYADATENALFSSELIDRWRIVDEELPDMLRIVVAVDPSGADDIDNTDNDEIGIHVMGLGTNGLAYALEDLTLKAGPATWGKVATDAYDRLDADIIVGETNYGGAMVKQTIATARANTPFKAVTASRGKVIRAEPIGALCETGKIRIVGYMPKLEDELCGFTTAGYAGSDSPNRADAFVWAAHTLFPKLTRSPKELNKPKSRVHRGLRDGWMAA